MKTAVDRTNRVTPPALPRWLPPLAFLLALGAAVWRIPAPPAVAFQPPAFSPVQMRQEIALAIPRIPGLQYRPEQAVAARWADGRRLLAWVGPGIQQSDEAAIWLSVQDRQGEWSRPLEVASRQSTAGGSFAFVKHIGSPALHAEGSWLHLWYIGHALGDRGIATLYHSVSTDGGKTWTLARRQPLSAGPNVGRFTLQTPIPLADGGVALPLAEDGTRPSRWLRFSATGRLIDQTPVAADDPLFAGTSARPLEIPQ